MVTIRSSNRKAAQNGFPEFGQRKTGHSSFANGECPLLALREFDRDQAAGHARLTGRMVFPGNSERTASPCEGLRNAPGAGNPAPGRPSAGRAWAEGSFSLHRRSGPVPRPPPARASSRGGRPPGRAVAAAIPEGPSQRGRRSGEVRRRPRPSQSAVRVTGRISVRTSLVVLSHMAKRPRCSRSSSSAKATVPRNTWSRHACSRSCSM